jgi:hypothetical protein
MLIREPSRLLLLLGVALVAACSDSSSSRANDPDGAPLATQRFGDLTSPTVRAPTSTTPLRLVITTPGEWQQFWSERFAGQLPMPPLPAVDFATEMVVAVTAGQKPSGGYSIRIESVTERGAELEAVVLEKAPGAACVVTGALTFPFDVIRVPRANQTVRFVDRQATNDCG